MLQTSSKAQKADRKQRRELEEGIDLLGKDGLEHQLGSDSDITVELENTSDKSEVIMTGKASVAYQPY